MYGSDIAFVVTVAAVVAVLACVAVAVEWWANRRG